ncbi:LPS-assembly protein LptD [Pseudooceanicola algae]|uniref:LPS-assembly protein LptD n=1 Tax=Pseudooceanicola algae TaxID=1537215 RepID=A0A418SE28_9RHOB|nr:LPS assembly protein LptD [Pseudooceanicola algae]QPM89548.1 LPS-assembly protein LptD [Pseudooceanicola algae]
MLVLLRNRALAHPPLRIATMRPVRPLRTGLATLAAMLCVHLAAPGTARAQETGAASVVQQGATDQDAPALLVADRVYMDGPGRLIAEGNVEALRDGLRLRASRIVYDEENGTLSVEGPITITGSDAAGDNSAVVLADTAELDADFRNGLLSSARIMLGQQVQMAAQQMARVDGRYNQLYKTTVSSCHVCTDGSPPLWQIRAERVVHDEVGQQLHFEHATLQVYGVSVFYLPYLRLPDPTQERATGFLTPTIRRNSELGTGIKLPYYIAMGDDRDLLLTPYVSEVTTTLEFRYRQAFSNGALSVSGAVANDTLDDADMRGYLQLAGTFYLPQDFVLRFNIEAISDDSYLTDYGYSDEDRLKSEIIISRARRDEWMRAALVHYHTLRDSEDTATIPALIADLNYQKRLFPAAMGGELRLSAEAHEHYRYSTLDYDSDDSDDITDGRDVTRLNVSADWRRSFTLAGGLRVETLGGLAIDSFYTTQDELLPTSQTGVTPYTAVTLRWPVQKVSDSGSVTIIEPVAQIAWSGGSQLDIANDESTRTEFDEGNLLGLTRFASPDRREHGWRGAYGAMISQFHPSGWTGRLVVGQILQDTPDSSFNEASGLTGQFSNVLVAGQVTAPGGWSLSARGLFDNEFSVTKTSARASWLNDDAEFGATYVWLGPDQAVDRDQVISEWTIDGAYQVSPNWGVSADIRYDVAEDQPASAGLGVTWTNECVDVNLAVSRTYTSSSVVTPSTDFSFTIGLLGFSTGGSSSASSGSCRN